ncbi:putative lignostilbene dioxygenase protein [Neofusicoccum parvum UCRNP2]|uniref:Putative lignostilbene dioxygenase protein n=1 Tax=Botryosphaeria parva (strain UCR-NP2) TaxID=1287680 RepID=R1E8Z3_BOTPV|nr:putative lignostilbene dioxygenase protein [Neofusicoccum parvum UCRNP2]
MAPHKITPSNVQQTEPFGLKSTWTKNLQAPFATYPGRFEGEIADLVVFGQVPKEIDGTFYRIMVDPFYPMDQDVPIEGDGNISAFRIHNGRVDMKVKYVETERLKLERKAQERLFGLYRNPFTHHPCVRAAVDSTANTNLVYWAGKLVALKESGLPYNIDPNTLDTLGYDPFSSPSKAKTFSAHPKVDPYTNELVVFGYEAKGLGSLDIVVYSLDATGAQTDVQWIRSPWLAFIHDCAITPNFLILVLWPFEGDVERMWQGKHHWTYAPHRPATFVVVPRRAAAAPPGWRPGEHRVYHWEHAVAMHTAGAWEAADGSLRLESSRVMYNILPCFAPEDAPPPPPPAEMRADYVRWDFDLAKPSGTKIADPLVVLDVPSEFPRIDERFMTHDYEWVVLDVILPETPGVVVPLHLNGLAMVNTKNGETRYFNPGGDCHLQEPVFIPRSEDAPQGDGWVMAMVERKQEKVSELVLLDTRNFETPVAIIRMPFSMMTQVHGNWVESSQLGEHKSLVRETGGVEVSGRGALEPEV